MRSLYAGVSRVLSVDEPSPLLKHVPTTIAFFAAILIALVLPDIEISLPIAFAGSFALGLFSLVLAYVFSKNPVSPAWAVSVPLIALLAIALLRMSTGGASSLFSSLLLLPVIWIAAEPGRRWILVAGVGTAFAIMMPFLILGETPADRTEWLRGVVAPLVYAVVAAIINEMSRQNRVQLHSIHALADGREARLAESRKQALEVEKSGEALRKAHELTNSVLDAVTVQAIIGTDLTGTITVWNPGATSMLARHPHETIGRASILDFHLEDELENRSRELNYPAGATVLNPGFSALVESARLGVGEVHEWTYRRADGSEVPVEVAVTPRVDASGRSDGYIFVATDITQALEVSKFKDEFIGLVSHELRTPLSSILGYLELLKDDEESPLTEEQALYLSVAERNAHRLLGLVGDLLFTAQTSAGGFPLALGDVTPGELVSAAVDSSRPMAEAAGVELATEGVPNSLRIVGDKGRLGQAIDNLVSNAIKFTPRGGSVRVGLSGSDVDGHVEITVRDTGLGIPAGELNQLFTRFFRATTATANAVPGVGLGLVITKSIVQAHGGELDVASVEGEGTVFTLRLPKDPAVVRV